MSIIIYKPTLCTHLCHMTERVDAQLDLYFGDSQRELKHSQSQANLLFDSVGKSAIPNASLSACSNSISETEDDREEDESSVGSDDNDIYSVVAWQFGHQRLGSVSDSATIAEPTSNKHRYATKNSKGLKWHKKLFRRKSTIKAYNENNDNNPLQSNAKCENNSETKRELRHSRSSIQLTSDCTNARPLSIKLQSPTNRKIRFELLLYEKRNKSKYKLMDHQSSKCVCSNIKRFDVKKFLSKQRMSIDHELQLIQTIQHYKQLMLSKKLSSNENPDESHDTVSTTSTEDDDDCALDQDIMSIEDDEDDEAFDLCHVTTPRRKPNPNSRFMQTQNIVNVVYDRYEKHTAHHPCLPNYLSLRKKQEQIETFYRDKVSDEASIMLIADHSCRDILKNWCSGKIGLKSATINKKQPLKNPKSADCTVDNVLPVEITQTTETSDVVLLADTDLELIEDGYISDDEQDEEDEDEDQSEDDSDASMDSDTLKRILDEAKQIEKKAKKQTKQNRIKIMKSKGKHVKILSDNKSDSNRTTYASLKPPTRSTECSSKKKRSKQSKTRKKGSSKRKGLKRRNKKHIPRFMKSKSHTPRKAHVVMNSDENVVQKKKKKRMKTNTVSKRLYALNDNVDTNVYLDSGYTGNMHSPQYLRLKSQNNLTKAIPVRVLGFGES
eukprot:386255_1